MPSQGAEKPRHETKGTPGFPTAQLLQEGKKTWRLDIVPMGCFDCFPHRGGDALQQRGIDGADKLAEDDQVPEPANGVRLFRRVDRELYDFVTLGEHAVKHLEHMGIA